MQQDVRMTHFFTTNKVWVDVIQVVSMLCNFFKTTNLSFPWFQSTANNRPKTIFRVSDSQQWDKAKKKH